MEAVWKIVSGRRILKWAAHTFTVRSWSGFRAAVNSSRAVISASDGNAISSHTGVSSLSTAAA
jgi:hypothetical protein